MTTHASEVPKDSQGAQMCWDRERGPSVILSGGTAEQTHTGKSPLCPVWAATRCRHPLLGGVLAGGQHCRPDSTVPPRVLLRVG